jgi:hypothetical protein
VAAPRPAADVSRTSIPVINTTSKEFVMSEQDNDKNITPQQEASTEGSTVQQGSKPASNEERLGTQLDKGDNIAGTTTGGQGEFGSHAPFGGGPKK